MHPHKQQPFPAIPRDASGVGFMIWGCFSLLAPSWQQGREQRQGLTGEEVTLGTVFFICSSEIFH